jgi:hypothetical protein
MIFIGMYIVVLFMICAAPEEARGDMIMGEAPKLPPLGIFIVLSREE